MPYTNNENKITLIGIYESYIKKYPEMSKKIPDYKTYKRIILKLNFEAQNLLLEGKPLDLGHRMGELRILKFLRRFTITKTGSPKLPVDWAETKKLWEKDPQAKALKKRVFFTDPFYVGLAWRRKFCNIKGKAAYGFDSSRTNGQDSKVGMKNRITMKLRKNPIEINDFVLVENADN